MICFESVGEYVVQKSSNCFRRFACHVCLPCMVVKLSAFLFPNQYFHGYTSENTSIKVEIPYVVIVAPWHFGEELQSLGFSCFDFGIGVSVCCGGGVDFANWGAFLIMKKDISKQPLESLMRE